MDKQERELEREKEEEDGLRLDKNILFLTFLFLIKL